MCPSPLTPLPRALYVIHFSPSRSNCVDATSATNLTGYHPPPPPARHTPSFDPPMLKSSSYNSHSTGDCGAPHGQQTRGKWEHTTCRPNSCTRSLLLKVMPRLVVERWVGNGAPCAADGDDSGARLRPRSTQGRRPVTFH
jgi:hypothetical protein